MIPVIVDSRDPYKMITLYLLRHAKSSHSIGLDDHARPLNDRGRADARRMGLYLKDQGIRPQAVGCSTALRTRETLEIVGDAAAWDEARPRRRFDQGLYLASPATILKSLDVLSSGASSLMIVGHNPGLHELAIGLAGPESPARSQLFEKFPTAALAMFECDAPTWNELTNHEHRLVAFVRPKGLPA